MDPAQTRSSGRVPPAPMHGDMSTMEDGPVRYGRSLMGGGPPVQVRIGLGSDREAVRGHRVDHRAGAVRAAVADQGRPLAGALDHSRAAGTVPVHPYRVAGPAG